MKLFINENCTVMKKNTMKTNIKQIRTISSRMPKTINEAINFNEDDDMEYNILCARELIDKIKE